MELYNFSEIPTSTSSYCRYYNQVLGGTNKCLVSKKPYLICHRLILSKVSCFDVKSPWWVFFIGVCSLSDLCSAGNVDALLDDVSGLRGIYILPESDLPLEEVIVAFCAIRKRSYYLIASISSSSLISWLWCNLIPNSSLALFIIFIASVTCECLFFSGWNVIAREQ